MHTITLNPWTTCTSIKQNLILFIPWRRTCSITKSWELLNKLYKELNQPMDKCLCIFVFHISHCNPKTKVKFQPTKTHFKFMRILLFTYVIIAWSKRNSLLTENNKQSTLPGNKPIVIVIVNQCPFKFTSSCSFSFSVQLTSSDHHKWGQAIHTCPAAWTSYQIRKIAGCACAGNAGNVFPATDFKGNR